MSSEDKIYLLQQENLKLLDTLSELKNTIKKIEQEFKYQEYFFFIKPEDLGPIKFEEKLNANGIKNYMRKTKGKGWNIKLLHSQRWLIKVSWLYKRIWRKNIKS